MTRAASAKGLHGIKLAAQPTLDMARAGRVEGRRHEEAQHRRRSAAQARQGARGRRLGDILRRQDLQREDEGRRPDHHRRARHPRQRFEAGGAAVPALRRQRHLLDRSARSSRSCRRSSSWSAPAISVSNSASRSASSAARSPSSKRWTASCRSTMRELVAPVAKWLKTNGVTVHLSAKAKGADKTGLIVEMADGNIADASRRQHPRHRRPQAEHRRLGPGEHGARHGRPLRQGRRPVPHLDEECLGGRRSRRRADAGAQGRDAGRNGRRDHRRQEAQLPSRPRSPRCASPSPRSSALDCCPSEAGPDAIVGACSLHGERPRAQHGCRRRLRARRRAQERSSRGRHPGRRRSMSPNCPANSPTRWRWARCSKTSPAPSMCIRP